MLCVAAQQVPEWFEALVKEVRQLRKQAAAGHQAEGLGPDQLLAAAAEVGGAKIVTAEVPGGTPQSLREGADRPPPPQGRALAALLGTRQDEGKVMLVAGLSRDLVDRGLMRFSGIRQPAEMVGGGGGGRPDMAQAGGKAPERAVRPSRPRRPTCGSGWALGLGAWVFGLGAWVLGLGAWVFGLGSWGLGLGASVLGFGFWVPSFDGGIQDPRPERPSLLAAAIRRGPPKPKTQDPRPKTQDPRPKTQDPRPKTQGPRPPGEFTLR